MNKRYKASFKDDLGRSHSMRLEVGCDAEEPTHKDAQPLVSHYLAAYGRSLSGVIALKRDKGANNMFNTNEVYERIWLFGAVRYTKVGWVAALEILGFKTYVRVGRVKWVCGFEFGHDKAGE